MTGPKGGPREGGAAREAPGGGWGRGWVLPILLV